MGFNAPIDWTEPDKVIRKLHESEYKEHIDARVSTLFGIRRQTVHAHRTLKLKLYIEPEKIERQKYLSELSDQPKPKKYLYGKERLLKAIKNKRIILKFNQKQMIQWLSEKTGREWLIEMSSYAGVPPSQLKDII